MPKSKSRTEDEVRNSAEKVLGFNDEEKDIKQGTGQLTTFNKLDFNGVKDKPDGWYLPDNKNNVAIILETKSEDKNLNTPSFVNELFKNCDIALKEYKKVVGILYNGKDIRVFKNKEEFFQPTQDLHHKNYYLKLFTEDTIDKQRIYNLTKKINDSLHINFGIKNLYHRMIFTACALVARKEGANLEAIKGMSYSIFHKTVEDKLKTSLKDEQIKNSKLELLYEVFSEIKMNSIENQEAIDNFIDWVCEISECVNSDYWNGEDVMGIFFNEFNRYKKKSESGQVFTPDHITSFMYRLIEVNQNDRVLDAACGSGAFLVKSMCNMIKEAGGVDTKKAGEIKGEQLFGIEFDREIFALACANMLIHKDGKTNLVQYDSRSDEACSWIREKNITKVLMNPPFERKYGCLKIVENVLDNVPANTICAFILPDKKLEKDNGSRLLKKHRLEKIIKLPEKTFSEGVTTSIFVFKTGIPQNDEEIFTCYFEDDGLETVKNQGRQDVKNKWSDIEEQWVDITVRRKYGDYPIKFIKPSECLSYQMPEKEFEIYEEDFIKTMMNYLMFEKKIDVKSFNDKLLQKVLYESDITKNEETKEVSILLKGEETKDGKN